MLVKVLAKGHLLIPESMCQALGPEPGTQLDVQMVGGKIVIECLGLASAVEALYGKYAESDFLADVEAEHHDVLTHERIAPMRHPPANHDCWRRNSSASGW